MLCDEVYQVLSGIKPEERVRLPDDVVTFLRDNGLLEDLSTSRYQDRVFEVGKVPQLEKDGTTLDDSIERDKERLSKLRDKYGKTEFSLCNWPAIERFFTTPGKKEKELEEIARLELSIPADERKRAGLKTRVSDLKAQGEDLKSYSEIAGGYCRVSEQGQNRRDQIEARQSRLQGVDFAEFGQEISTVEDAIQKRFDRFLETHNLLIQLGFKKGDRDVVRFASALSMQEGEVKDIVDRASVVNNYLYNHKWTDYDRLAIVSAVSSQPGDIQDLTKQLEQVYLAMRSDNHSQSYGTWLEAAEIMRIKGADEKEKYKRFCEVKAALDKRQWQGRSHETCYITAILAQQDGDPETIAEQFRNLELKLVESGRNDCIESGIASLILITGQGTLEERAKRFNDTFLAMQKYGWQKSASNYGTDAILSLMPGTSAENPQLLKQTMNFLVKKGWIHWNWDDYVDFSLPLIGSGYVDAGLHPEESQSSYWQYRRSHSSRLNSGGFNGIFGLGAFGIF